MDLKDQFIEILVEAWDTTPEDLQLSITLNPDINRFLECLRRSYELGVNSHKKAPSLIYSGTVRTTLPLALHSNWFEMTPEEVPLRMGSTGKLIGYVRDFQLGSDGMYAKVFLDKGMEEEIFVNSEFSHSGVTEFERGERVLVKTLSINMFVRGSL